MRKVYFVVLFAVSLTALVFSAPGIGLVALLFTFGLAIIVLAPLPYLLVGLWSILPCILFWRSPVLRWVLLLLGVFAGSWVFLGPPKISDKRLQADLSAQEDVLPTPINISNPIGIEIHRRASRHSDLYVSSAKSGAFYGSQVCFELCERLLTGGDVAWVRIVVTDDAYGNHRARTHALLVPGQPDTCSRLNTDRINDGLCAMFSPDHGHASDLTIVLNEGRTDWRAKRFAPYQLMGLRTAEARLGNGLEGPILFKLSQLFHERPTGHISIDFGNLGGGDHGGGFQLVRARASSPPIDLAAAVSALSIKLGPVREPLPKSPGTERNSFIAPPPDAQDAIYAASLVAVGPGLRPTRYSNAFQGVINDWHSRLRWKTILSNEDKRIFCETVQDNRIENLFWDDQVIRKHGVRCG